jgi:hypothetical protein
MRKIIFILLLAISLNSCSDDIEPAFDIDVETFFVIPAGLNSIDTHIFEIFNVPTFIQSSSQTTRNAVTSVRSNRARLTGRFTNINFRIIERISIRAISPLDTQNEKEIFWMDFIPVDQDGDLELFSSLPNVDDILLQDNIHLQVRINFKTFVPSDIETRMLLNFKAFINE